MPPSKKKTRFEQKDRLPPGEAARRLRRLADDLEAGRIEVGREALDIGAPVFMETELKIKGAEVSCEITLKAPVAAPHGPPEPVAGAGGGGPEAKVLKKALAARWKSIKASLSAGRAPGAAEGPDFLELARRYEPHVQPDWAADWHACIRRAEACLQAASAGDIDAAEDAAAGVDRDIRRCHKRYK
ncbi:hypothetical protein G3N55_02330 [Dissulfurirhabdus thermomarina]|uniref:GAK system XXXCH domain-containing protein n=1 Tax=Dissulfurirhabdus thermomarina TaxID=1765737 RepID=A0A6N9TK97_DISTH|nr:hypothetical protein [Dissulfurirhabdus thermomarina]NDY41691.1 hypothetical protein [Dissulfurirhabdus thermomarina]NMX22741.1 hypothetical protein [Dissulfurirhabdus thermomarina]